MGLQNREKTINKMLLLVVSKYLSNNNFKCKWNKSPIKGIECQSGLKNNTSLYAVYESFTLALRTHTD